MTEHTLRKSGNRSSTLIHYENSMHASLCDFCSDLICINLKIIVLCHSQWTFDKSKPCYKREWYISSTSTVSSTNPKKEMEIKSHNLPSLLWRCGLSANCFSLSQSWALSKCSLKQRVSSINIYLYEHY